MSAKTAPRTSSPATDRIRESTDKRVARAADRAALERLRAAASAGDADLSKRVAELDRESDVERWLMVNASVIALVTLALGAFVTPWLLLATAIVLSFLLQHGIQGWCPPLPLFRRMGARTRREIAAERAAAKALRGDFDDVDRGARAADHALAAASRP